MKGSQRVRAESNPFDPYKATLGGDKRSVVVAVEQMKISEEQAEQQKYVYADNEFIFDYHLQNVYIFEARRIGRPKRRRFRFQNL